MNKKLYSIKLVELHYWVACSGILLYITSMWTAGITQGLMWRTYDNLGFLKYSFVETLVAVNPFYVIRAVGGLLFIFGALIMWYNLIKTYQSEEVAK